MEQEDLINAKVLVTGASGFIGSALSKKLLKLGAIVYGVSRRNIKTDDGIKWYKGDLSDLDFVTALIKEIKPDYIYHMASHVCGARNYENMELTFKSNLVTTFNLLLTIHNIACKRIILAGSFEEVNSNSDISIPSSPYAAAKFAALNYALLYHKLFNTPVCIASIYMVYGPGQKDLKKLIPYVILNTLNQESPKLTSGNRNVDWVYVDDVIDALIKMLLTPGIEGESIDIGSGKSIKTKKMVNMLINLIDSHVKPQFWVLNDRVMEQEKNARVSETFDKIGWYQKTELRIGLSNTIQYFSNLS